MTSNYFFSIVIPTYEVQGNGVHLLSELLISLDKQTFKNFEVIISDHSIDNEIENFIKDCTNNFKIIYHRNTVGRGNSSINMNNGIRLSNAKYIKIIHIDDKFSTDESLEIIYSNIENSDVDIIWGVVGFNHFYQDKNKIYLKSVFFQKYPSLLYSNQFPQ
jgi:glycosyltransferase involved in cell wall biosynthesis